MPQLSLKIPKTLSDDLTAFCRMGNEKLIEIAGALTADGVCITKPADLRAAIAIVVPEQAGVVERVVLGLSSLKRQAHVTVDEILISVQKAVNDSSWSDGDLGLWKEAQPALRELLENRSILFTAKALDLLYDHDHFFVGAKILTNIRPVFDENKESFVGAAVNQLLRLEYSSASGESTNITLTIDEEDIKWLRDACVDALKKATSVSNQLQSKWNLGSLTIDEIKNDKS